MADPAQSMTVVQDTTIPTVAHLIMQAVLVCNCEARIVMLVNIIGGEVECPQCKHKWRMQSIAYSVEDIETPDGPKSAGKINFQLAQLTAIDAAPGIILPGDKKWKGIQ